MYINENNSRSWRLEASPAWIVCVNPLGRLLLCAPKAKTFLKVSLRYLAYMAVRAAASRANRNLILNSTVGAPFFGCAFLDGISVCLWLFAVSVIFVL